MDLLQGLTASLLVIAALAGTVMFLKNRGLASFDLRRGSTPRRLQSLERLTLTPQHSLHLVRLDNRVLLIASAPGGCSVLGPFDDFADALKAARAEQPGFGGPQ